VALARLSFLRPVHWLICSSTSIADEPMLGAADANVTAAVDTVLIMFIMYIPKVLVGLL
jgi:hypothetical protein